MVEYILVAHGRGWVQTDPNRSEVVGGIVMLHAAMTIGPLGAFRAQPSRSSCDRHGVIALEVVAGVEHGSISIREPRFVVVGIAFVHLFVWGNSSFATRNQVRRRLFRGGRSTESVESPAPVGNGVNVVRRPRAVIGSLHPCHSLHHHGSPQLKIAWKRGRGDSLPASAGLI